MSCEYGDSDAISRAFTGTGTEAPPVRDELVLVTKEREWRFRVPRQADSTARLKEILDDFIATQREIETERLAEVEAARAAQAEASAAAAAAAAIGGEGH